MRLKQHMRLLLHKHLSLASVLKTTRLGHGAQFHYGVSTLHVSGCNPHQKLSFDCLNSTHHPINCSHTKKVIVNPTDRTTDQAVITTFRKGLNFAQSSNAHSNLKDNFSSTEWVIQQLPAGTVEEVWQEASYILRHSKLHKQKTFKAKQDALRVLRNNDSIIILPAYKGNATTVSLNEDYYRKMQEILNDRSTRSSLQIWLQ
jgi:hypothetical protein